MVNLFCLLGMRLIAFFAADGGGGAAASAAQPYQPPYAHGCCSPAKPNGPYCPYTNTMSDFNCGPYPDTTRQFWICNSGSTAMGCGECTKNTVTCWMGPFSCSTWWLVNP
jgi:hypothetical protein